VINMYVGAPLPIPSLRPTYSFLLFLSVKYSVGKCLFSTQSLSLRYTTGPALFLQLATVTWFYSLIRWTIMPQNCLTLAAAEVLAICRLACVIWRVSSHHMPVHSFWQPRALALCGLELVVFGPLPSWWVSYNVEMRNRQMF
jgi:hypothetical protein